MSNQEEFEEMWRELYARASPEKRKYLLDLNKRTPDRTSRRREWIDQLASLAGTLEAAGTRLPWPFFDAFWIRLHEVLNELPKDFEIVHQIASEQPKPLPPGGLGTLGVAVYEKAILVRGALNDDEVICADYLRQRACHMQQSAYAMRWNKKEQAPLEEREIKLLGKSIHVDEVDRIRNELVAKHGSEEALAVDLAGRLRGPLSAVIGAFDALDAYQG